MTGVALCILGADLIVLRGELKTLVAMSFVLLGESIRMFHLGGMGIIASGMFMFYYR